MASIARKSMTFGEGGTAIAFTLLAFLCHRDRREGLHAGIRVPRLSVRRRQRRGGVRDPQPLLRPPGRARAALHRRQAELQYGAGQVRDRRGDVLGHRGLHGRALRGARACLPGAQFRSALDHLRPPPAAAHLGGDLRVRRQRADRDVVLCRAAHLPRAARRRHRAVVRGARLQLLHPDRRHRLSARHHAVEGIRRARVVRRSLAHRRVGRRICWCSSAR